MSRNEFAEAYFYKYSVENKLSGVVESIRKCSPQAETNAQKFFPKVKKQAEDNTSKQNQPSKQVAKAQPKKHVPASSSSDSSSDSDAVVKPAVQAAPLKKSMNAQAVAKLVPAQNDETSCS